MSVAVIGTGAGALAVAADLSRHGRDPVIADLPQFAANLEPIREKGGVSVTSEWHGSQVEPVRVADTVELAVESSDLVIVVVPCFGHQTFADLLAPLLSDEQTLLFLGEGSGSIVARRALQAAGKPGVVVAEANTLPYLARLTGPGSVFAAPKSGGVFVAALPSTFTATVLGLITDVWPYMSAAESVWDTVLMNYNAIDHVGPMIANAGVLQNRSGGILLWGEGATPAVVNVISAVDAELRDIRLALGSSDKRGYRELLIAQGFAIDVGPDLRDVLKASKLATAVVPTGPGGGLETRYITEDVPYALAFASSLGRACGVDTPVIDGLIALASAMVGQDFRSEGRNLDVLGLGGRDAAGLREFAATGTF